MKLLFVRHGAMKGDPFICPSFPVEGCLSDAGVRQAEALRGGLADVKVDAAYSSKYGRAMQTAQIALGGRGLSITTVDGLEEWHPAQLEREVPSTEFEKMMERDKLLYMEETWKTEQGEGTFDMCARVIPALLGALAQEGWHARMGGWVPDEGAADKTIAVFAHGGSLNTALSFMLGLRPFPCGSFSLPYCGVAEIGFSERHGIFYPYLQLQSRTAPSGK